MFRNFGAWPSLWLRVSSLAGLVLLVGCSDDPNHENPPEGCENGAEQTLSCGLNQRGSLVQQCVAGAWKNSVDCVDADVCVDGTVGTPLTCGESADGTLAQRCVEGQWADEGECKDCAECAPFFEQQPEGLTVDLGESVRFEAIAAGGSAPYLWQWESQVAEDAAWLPIEDATDSVLEFVGTAEHSDVRFRAIVTDAHGLTVVSESAHLIVWHESALPPGAAYVDDAKIVFNKTPGGLWVNALVTGDNPPAVTTIDLNYFYLTDVDGNPVATELVQGENSDVLQLRHIERSNGEIHDISVGTYFFILESGGDEDVQVIHEGQLKIRSDRAIDKEFVVTGLSILAKAAEPDALSTIEVEDAQGHMLPPLSTVKTSADLRQDYVILSNGWYYFEVTPALEGYQHIRRGVYSPANNDRYVTVQATASYNVVYRVPKGAKFGAYNKVGGRHYVPFAPYITRKDEAASAADTTHDVYVVKIPHNDSFHIEVSIPGETVKEVRMQRFSAQPDEQVIALLPIDPADVGDQGYFEADLYTNLDDSGVLNLQVSHPSAQEFDLDLLRVWQAMQGVVGNYFVEPNFVMQTFGDANVSLAASNTPGRDRIRVRADEPGVSVVTVGYEPIRIVQTNGTTVDKFSAITPANLGVVVVQVGEENVDAIDMGITTTAYDTHYFNREESDHALFTFTPTALTELGICVHDPLHTAAWNTAWTCFDQNEDGSFTVELKEGRNIIRALSENSSDYYVVNAKGLTMFVDNASNPGAPLADGDTAEIYFDGLRMPIQKLSGMYNPGFPAGVWLEFVFAGERLDGKHTQYNFNQRAGHLVTIRDLSSGTHVLEFGRIHNMHLGSPLGAHRVIPEGGMLPNFAASQPPNDPYFSFLPNFSFDVF